MACYQDVNPIHRIISVGDNPELIHLPMRNLPQEEGIHQDLLVGVVTGGEGGETHTHLGKCSSNFIYLFFFLHSAGRLSLETSWKTPTQ